MSTRQDEEHHMVRRDQGVSDLLVRVGQGDRTAMSELVDLLYEPVRVSVGPTLPDSEVADEVLTAFLRVWRHAPTYDPGVPPLAWVLTHIGAAAPARTPAEATMVPPAK